MTGQAKFVDDMTASTATWHGVAPPNDVALRMLGDLEKMIRDFEAALLKAASVGVRPASAVGFDVADLSPVEAAEAVCRREVSATIRTDREGAFAAGPPSGA